MGSRSRLVGWALKQPPGAQTGAPPAAGGVHRGQPPVTQKPCSCHLRTHDSSKQQELRVGPPGEDGRSARNVPGLGLMVPDHRAGLSHLGRGAETGWFLSRVWATVWLRIKPQQLPLAQQPLEVHTSQERKLREGGSLKVSREQVTEGTADQDPAPSPVLRPSAGPPPAEGMVGRKSLGAASVEAGQDKARHRCGQEEHPRSCFRRHCRRLTHEGGHSLITARAACEASTVLPGLRVMKQGERGHHCQGTQQVCRAVTGPGQGPAPTLTLVRCHGG